LGQSQCISRVIDPLSVPAIHHRPDALCIIGRVINTIDSVDLHIHTMFWILNKHKQRRSRVKRKIAYKEVFFI
jgi:hypothetical protein